MSVRRLKQTILSIWSLQMIYDYLLADLKRPYPSHLNRTFGQKGNVLPFLGLQTPLTPPPPLRREWMKFAHERLQPSKKKFGSANAIVQQHLFHNILQGISIIYTNNKLHNYSKCKNFRQVLLQRAGRGTYGLSLCFSGSGTPIHFFNW